MQADIKPLQEVSTFVFHFAETDAITNLLGYQLLKPSGRTGPLDVTAKITGYKPEVLKLLGLDSQPALVKPKANSVTEDEDGDEDDSLTDTVDLILVDDVSVDPGKDSLFNHPNNKVS